jgi:arsenite methyltransferase
MSESIVDKVRERYGAVAAGTLSGEHAGVQAVAQAFGYSAEELASLPAEANMGLSCGNPTAFASLRSGEVVVDLGCGGGLDVLLAASQVGPGGKVVGIDMTPEMLERARANAAKRGTTNVEFHQATIDKLPLADGSVDCVISNCVVNLVPDKPAVFREMARVLKPGGRVAVSDIALKRALPPEIGNNLLAYIGCVAGAISFAEYESGLRAAGFASVQLVDTGKDLNAYTQVGETSGCGCATSTGCGTDTGGLHADLAELTRRYNVNDYAASVRVYAVKGAWQGGRARLQQRMTSAVFGRLETAADRSEVVASRLGPACSEPQSPAGLV